jgi:hypothetical protein
MITMQDLQVVSQSPVRLPPIGTMVAAAFSLPLLHHLAPSHGKVLPIVVPYGMSGLDLMPTMIVVPMSCTVVRARRTTGAADPAPG